MLQRFQGDDFVINESAFLSIPNSDLASKLVAFPNRTTKSPKSRESKSLGSRLKSALT